MKRYGKYTAIIATLVVSLIFLPSCKDFLDPEQEINITEDKLLDDWYEYRSLEMGLYGIQRDLVEQLVILGELRGDLLKVTENADAEMVEIYNFNISPDNKYASPTNFFKLISATNNFIKLLTENHPEVLDKNSPITNFDRLYGEALCMRAWAYFYAVRIYGKVPFIHESLTTIDEINNYIESTGTYIDSVDIQFSIDGYYNDTTYNTSIQLEKQYFDLDLVIDYFTNELETKVKAVGVNHAIENNDRTWEVSIWNTHAMNALLGQMYLTQGDLAKSVKYFEKIMRLPSEDYRYQLDQSFSNSSWRNIFTGMDPKEHIYTIWFNKNNFQQHNLQKFFDIREPNNFMLKPTYQAVVNWESMWRGTSISVNQSQPWKTRVINAGIPGDLSRGYGASYIYWDNGMPLMPQMAFNMMYLRAQEDLRTANLIMGNADTVVWKYSIGKGPFDQDANFIVYRAAGVHLWAAEAYTYWITKIGSIVRNQTFTAQQILNDGSNYSSSTNREQMGVRGRVGFGSGNSAIQVGNIIYQHDPFNNKITGYLNYGDDFLKKQQYLEDKIMEERARELAFEGERFYDLMRVAKRRNDPSYLAEKVSKKFPEGKREEIYNLLLDENNWYIKYFE